MKLKNEQERINTKIKLDRLSERRRALSLEAGGDEELREMTIESLNGTINELREEIALYNARHAIAGKANQA